MVVSLKSARSSSGIARRDLESPTPFEKATRNTIHSKYFYAMLVYLVNATAMVANDGVGGVSAKNAVYFVFAIIHLVNAIQFAWSWDTKRWWEFELIPEYLNMIESALYIWSSSLYGHLYITDDDNSWYSTDFFICRKLELIASVVEILASVGWIVVWYRMFIETVSPSLTAVPGRGLSVYDPDFHANWTLLLGAMLYFIYNWRVYRNPQDYETDFLYEVADIVYVINAIFYMVATLRDLGWSYGALCGVQLQLVVRTDVASDEKLPLWLSNATSDHRNYSSQSEVDYPALGPVTSSVDVVDTSSVDIIRES